MVSSQSSRTTRSRENWVLFSMSIASSLNFDHSAQVASTSSFTRSERPKAKPTAAVAGSSRVVEPGLDGKKPAIGPKLAYSMSPSMSTEKPER